MGTAERNTEHRLLVAWLEKEGRGAMTRLVSESGKTWAAINRIVHHGVMPQGDTAKRLAEITGHTSDEIIEASEEARSARLAS